MAMTAQKTPKKLKKRRPRQPVYLLAVGSKKLLIACGKDGPRLLADVTAGLARSAGCDENFADVLDNQTEVSE